jgi:hypothetical protein
MFSITIVITCVTYHGYNYAIHIYFIYNYVLYFNVLVLNISAGVTVDESISGWGAKEPSEAVTAPMHLLMSCDVGTGLYYGSDAKRSPMHKYRSPGTDAYDGSEGR